MFNYLAFLHGGISQSTGDALTDGSELSRQCLDQLNRIDNPEHFPPRLLILLTSPAYLEQSKAERLLAGVHQTFAEAGYDDIPLIGSSVAVVFFDRRTHEQGALLVCFASRMVRVEVAVSENARNDHEEATARLLGRLGLNFTETGADPNPKVNRLLFTFFPGFGGPDSSDKYPAPELHRLLRDKVRARVPIVGGVSSTNDRNRAGLQLAGANAYTDALVAARLSAGFPITSSIGHGLASTGRFLRVKKLGDDRRTILEFKEGVPADLLGLRHQKEVALLGEMSLDRDPTVTVARMAGDGQSVTMLREVRGNSSFELLEPESKGMLAETARLMERALQRLRVRNPVGCFGIHCNARRAAEPDIERMAAGAESLLKRGTSYVGGFFDGEIGLDQTGRSLFGNWCVATLFFGDEMLESTPSHRGFAAMAERAPKLTGSASLNEAIEHSLELIYRTGFPGAMISLVLRDQEQEWAVARKSIGARFGKIVEITKRPFSDNDILTIVAREKKPVFISDSRADERCNQEAVEKSGIVSQYVIPLLNLYHQTIAVLQVDLGQAPDEEHFQKSVLDSLGAVISAILARIHNREEINIARELDEALKKSLSEHDRHKALQRYIAEAISIFGAEMGHIRLADKKEKVLVIRAGCGEYYDFFKKDRRRAIRFNDHSPTCKAFRGEESVVVNDAHNNEWHLSLMRRYRDNTQAKQILNRIESYANVPIKDDRDKPIGALSLQTSTPWFFTRAHANSLAALSQRISYLLEHFSRKEEEQKAITNLSFLYKVSSQSPREAKLKPLQALKDLTARFRKAANADLASLYLWDAETECFVLRAQDGWSLENWVDIARYRAKERWTGRVALKGEPEYVPDLYVYKKKEGLLADRNYGLQMFGSAFSEENSAEALGLPFVIEGNNRGVLTLYNRLDPNLPKPDQHGNGSRFRKVSTQVLKTATEILAAVVISELRQLRADWEIGERDRHEEILKAMENAELNEAVEMRMCRQLALTYSARAVAFYRVEDPDAPDELDWAAGFRRWREASPMKPVWPDQSVRQAALEGKTVEIRHTIEPESWGDREIAMTENIVERVCLPLFDDNDERRLIGVLDIRWGVKDRRFPQMERPHNRKYLEILGRKMASAYLRQKQLAKQKEIESKEKRSRLAVEVMAAMVFQTSHRFLNLVEDIRSMPGLIIKAETEAERLQRINELSTLIAEAPGKIKRPLDVAKRVREIKPRLCDLRALVFQALQESNISQKKPDVDVQLMVPARRFVRLDQELTREAFHNIINNAIKAMPDGGALKISAIFSADKKHVEISFADTGIGMSDQEIEAAKTGFVTTQSSTGLGVLVSRLLISAQDGQLEIKSRKEAGTEVIIILLYDPMESSP